jgi:hypothetical protein
MRSVIHVVIEPQSDIPTINVQIEDAASVEDMRAAWGDASNGNLLRQIRDAIGSECAKRGIHPREVITDPPQLN